MSSSPTTKPENAGNDDDGDDGPSTQQQAQSTTSSKNKRRIIVDDDDSDEEEEDIGNKSTVKKDNDDHDDDAFRDTPSPPPPPPPTTEKEEKKEDYSAAAAGITSAAAPETAATTSTTTDAAAAANDITDDMSSPCSCYASLEELQKAQDFEIMDHVEWGPGVKEEGYDSDQELAPRPKKKFNDPCGCEPDDEDDPTIVCCMDDSCINFATYEECRINCTAGRNCGNQRLQLRQFPPLQVFDAGPQKGLGMRTALQDLKKGCMVAEYTGRAIKESALIYKLFQNKYQHERRLYIMALEDGVYIDARQKGGLARFVNHSCSPNCRVERWKVNGKVRAAVVTIQDIAKGGELTFDYQWRRQRGRAPTKCYCGAPNCRGTLEVSKSMEEDQLDKSLEGQNWESKKKYLKTNGGKLDKRIVNRTIRVFSKEHQEYFLGQVTGYDAEKQLHQVLYQGSDLKQLWEDLSKEDDWMILDETAMDDQPFRIAKKNSSSDLQARRTLADGATTTTSAGGGATSATGVSGTPPGLLTASFAQRQGRAKHYLYVQTPIRQQLCENPKNFMLENVQRSCRVQVSSQQFARPPLNCNMADPEDVEKYEALDKSHDGTVWKLSITGTDVQRAHAILVKNTAFLEKKMAGKASAAAMQMQQQQQQQPAATSNTAVAAMMMTQGGGGQSSLVPRPLAPDSAPSSADTHEVIYPRIIADQVKRRIGAIRDKCRNVSISFAASESKSKRISRLMLDGSLISDLDAAKEQLWELLLQLCREAGAPMQTRSDVPRDLGFLGGALSKEQFQLLLNSSSTGNNIRSDATDSDEKQDDTKPGGKSQQRTNLQYLNQHANEDFNQSPLLASFESFNGCAVWVQSEDDMGRIDSSHRIVNDASSTNLRKVYFGCPPKDVAARWGQLQSRAGDLAKGVRFAHLGADRVYLSSLQKNGYRFFEQVRALTGAAVTLDNMTGDHLRIDGRDAILPVMETMTAGGIPETSLPRAVHAISQEQRTSLAEEIVRLQVELYRDHFTREQNWLFGRDWTLSTLPVGSGGVTTVAESGNKSVSSTAYGKLDGKSAALCCMEIAEVVANLGLDKRVGAHAAIILYRFVTTADVDKINLKAREGLLACVFLANKAQKLSKWRKLEAVLQAGYKVFYPGTRFDPEMDEALNLEEKVIAAEKEILNALEYDIFVREIDSFAVTLMNSMVKWKKKKDFVDTVFSLAFSGQMLGAGAELWVKYGLEYVFTAAAAFLKVDLKTLLPKLPLIPVKVYQTAELMTQSAKLGRPASSDMPSHPLVEGSKGLLKKYLPGIKESCMAITIDTSKLDNEQQRYRIIGDRNRRRSCIRGIPRKVVQDSILSITDRIATDDGCSIFVTAGSQPETDDIELVGSWRGVAVADHLIRSKLDKGCDIPPAVDVSGESPSGPPKLPTKTRGGLLEASEIRTSSGWEGTMQLEGPENTDALRLGGKSCVAGKISKQAVRNAGLRWWIFPKFGPAPTGDLCDSLAMRSKAEEQLEALAMTASSTVGDMTAFPVLASIGDKQNSAAGPSGGDVDDDDRMLAISVQRWPSEKIATKEEKRIGKTKRGRNMQMGFSAAAIQEMQVLTQLHRLIPSPRGHPNFILPVGIAVPAEKETPDTPVLGDDPMFSLFRSSAENEKAATKEKQVKTSPHLVFQKTPFVIQKFMSRKHGVDDLLANPAVVAAWFHDLISALVHCHSNQVLLRSLQPEQIAVDHTGVAKLSGLYRSRVISLEDRDRSPNLIKEAAKRKGDKKRQRDDDELEFQGNSYIAPEMLLGCPNHSKATDVWTVGCLLANLLLSRPLFQGKERDKMLLSIYKVVGTPAMRNFEEAVRLPHYSKPESKYPREVKKAFAHFLGEANSAKYAKAVDLIGAMLELDPSKRCTATEALNHEFMVEYVESSNEREFRERYVKEWTALKEQLWEASESGLNTERRLKRKALLLAAAVDDDKDGDDLYDLDDIMGDSAVAAKKRKA